MARTGIASATESPAVIHTKKEKWIGLIVAIAIGVTILASPTPQGLTIPAHRVLAITAFTVGLWVFQVMNNGVASVLMMALMIVAGIAPTQALSGFSQGSFWILISVLFYGCAMQLSGLARRISYYLLSLFPGTYAGVLSAFFLLGFVLALGVPSVTVRTAIMAPIAWALVQSARPEKPMSRGSALIMLSTVEMAAIPGVAFLLGSLNGPVIQQVFLTAKIPLDSASYAKVMAIPTLIFCGLVLVANQMVFRPDSPLDIPRDFARNGLRAVGNVKTSEKITGLVLLASIGLWATESHHHLPSFVIGMIGLGVLVFTGAVPDSAVATGIPWSLVLFLGGIFSLQAVVQANSITEWLSGYFVPIATHLSFSAVVLMVALGIAVYALRFLDPSGFIVIPVLFLPIVDVMAKTGIPPLVLVAPSALVTAPFWVSYQNIWIAMTEAITENQAFSAGARVRFATTYAIAGLIALAISVGYWKMIGVLS
jgi:di/tricarboxylate transporter